MTAASCFVWDGSLADDPEGFAAAYFASDTDDASKRTLGAVFNSPSLVDVLPDAQTDRVVLLDEVTSERNCPVQMTVRTAAHVLYTAGLWASGVLVVASTASTSRVSRQLIDSLGLTDTCAGLAVGHSNMTQPGATVRNLIW